MFFFHVPNDYLLLFSQQSIHRFYNDIFALTQSRGYRALGAKLTQSALFVLHNDQETGTQLLIHSDKMLVRNVR